MRLDEIVKELQSEVETVKGRMAVDDEAVDHLQQIFSIAFAQWYDPDNAASEKVGREVYAHIAALNKKWRFRA